MGSSSNQSQNFNVHDLVDEMVEGQESNNLLERLRSKNQRCKYWYVYTISEPSESRTGLRDLIENPKELKDWKDYQMKKNAYLSRKHILLAGCYEQ